jgi:hypothetical protein
MRRPSGYIVRNDAERLHKETLALRRKFLGADHPSTLQSMHYLAETYDRHGRRADAVALLDKCWQGRCRRLGPDHPHAKQPGGEGDRRERGVAYIYIYIYIYIYFCVCVCVCVCVSISI